MQILDDAKYVEKVDKFHMRDILEQTPIMLKDGLDEAASSSIQVPELSSYRAVIVAGLGGSAISGDIIADWIGDSVSTPIIVSRSYMLPGFADEETFFIAASYSGNTIETITQTRQAIKRRCKICAVTTGGRLEQLCSKRGIPILKVKGGTQPRLALPYLLASTSTILQCGGLIRELSEMNKAAQILSSMREDLKVEVPTEANEAKRLAVSLKGGLPRIYTLQRLGCVARRLKDQLNENAKVEAKFDLLPEICHNEIEGFSATVRDFPQGLLILMIRDGLEDKWEKDLIASFHEVISNSGVEKILNLYGEGETRLENTLTAIYLADYTSYYLALLRGVDPTMIPTIDSLKKSLARRGLMSI